MGILNRASDGQLTVLLALVRTLRAYGPMPEERLRALCGPKSLIKDESQSSGQLHKTLTRWKKLGLFTEDSSAEPKLLRLTSPFDAIGLEPFEAMRSPLLALALRTENNPLQGEVEGGEGDASDLALTISWVLQQDPYVFSPNWDYVESLQNQQGAAPVFMTNDTRWDGLVDWAPFLGLARSVGGKFMPNPVHAVRSVLKDVFGSEKVLPAHAFLSALARFMPVIDRGIYWQAAAARLKSPWLTLGPSQISPCLSLALLQLDHERRLRLEQRSDSPDVCQLLGRGGHMVSQVTHVSLFEVRS